MNQRSVCGLESLFLNFGRSSTIPGLPLKNSVSFKSQGELEGFLEKLPQYSEWGVNNAKSSANLWSEIEAGESTITQEGNRSVRVVVCQIRRHPDDEEILVELEQTLADGRRRVRPQRSMAEKLVGTESPLEALHRGLAEELSLAAPDFTLSQKEPTVSVKQKMSASYPGMMSQYERFIFQIVTDKLPPHDFTVQEPDGIRSATWGWRTPIMAD